MSDEEFTERLLTASPVTIRRRVLWGECDPAGVVYTPRFADYAASAATWFIRLVVRPVLGEAVGTPMKAMHFEFIRTLKPEEVFDMRVGVVEVRSRTFDLRVEARGIDGAMRFIARMTPILVDPTTFTSLPMPTSCKDKLIEYRDAHAPPLPGAGGDP